MADNMRKVVQYNAQVVPRSNLDSKVEEVEQKDAKKSQKSRNPSKFLYVLDTFLARRRNQMLMVLFMIAGTIIVGGCLFAVVPHSTEYKDAEKVVEAMWHAWTFMADAGTQAGADNLPERLVAFVITWAGIFLFTVIIGFVVEEIRDKMEALKKGKSSVVEFDHTLILGFTDKTVGIIVEIAMANESDGGGTIVLLAKGDKQIVEAELFAQLRNTNLYGTRVVVRTGTPLYVADLEKVSARTARSIIVLADDEVALSDPDKADANALRVVLALRGLGSDGLRGHIVAELRDVDNAALVDMAGGDHIDTLVSHDIIGRLMLLSARQPGLAKVYNAVLGFEGHEFYLKQWPSLVGHTFGSITTRFAEAIPIGVKTASGNIVLKPSQGRMIKPGDQILVIAEDDDTYRLCAALASPCGPAPKYDSVRRAREKILICGWRRDIRDIITLLDHDLAEHSEVHLLCEMSMHTREAQLRAQGLDVQQLKRLTLVHHEGAATNRRCLEMVLVEDITAAMILADESREADVINSDSHVLATLLLIRDIQDQMKHDKAAMVLHSNLIEDRVQKWNTAKRHACTIVCELLDFRTQQTIVQQNRTLLSSDFVQSNMLISQILAMVAENRGVKVILDELLGPHGCSLSLFPASRYVHLDEKCSFWTICQRAAKQDQIVCGYQHQRMDGTTVMNPPDKAQGFQWSGIDIVVIAGDAQMMQRDAELAINVVKNLGATRVMRSISSKQHFKIQSLRLTRTPLVESKELPNECAPDRGSNLSRGECGKLAESDSVTHSLSHASSPDNDNALSLQPQPHACGGAHKGESQRSQQRADTAVEALQELQQMLRSLPPSERQRLLQTVRYSHKILRAAEIPHVDAASISPRTGSPKATERKLRHMIPKHQRAIPRLQGESASTAMEQIEALLLHCCTVDQLDHYNSRSA